MFVHEVSCLVELYHSKPDLLVVKNREYDEMKEESDYYQIKYWREISTSSGSIY